MIQLPEEFDSIFRYIVVVSQRAEQLINGAKPRSESRHLKPTLVARDDVEAGEVTWRVLTQEELDAHRQALVEQFRAEVDAASEQPTEPIPDVLPTADTLEPVEDDEERDDELERLQRLLGMARTPGSAEDDGSSDDEEELADADDSDDEEED
ncbi:MAG: DNA-directed RNA polymerase subunit omega [Acidobacteria bacterium]|jgi:DNA-directed RNA polymerase subunit K/omega|nr:DNA-directed RNA polymerase subunit omega [Acidobacteriota bacterium]